jgi:molybdopterin/thiamine biosynthesis adenylyltransferase/rhodanese-related sulfurtransferase
MSKLTKEELIRYNRHLVLQEFGLEAQLKLKEAKVLVVGAGGLGSPALLYLTAAGVGTIGIVDHDDVSLSNLQRQILFTTNDVGKNKSTTAANRLTQLNPEITFNTYVNKITSANAESIVCNYDIVLDGTDNFPTRYLLNDVCIILNKTLIYGSILTFEGQVSVFNYLKKDGTYSSNYRDLFPEPPDAESVPNCEQAGVLGVLPGIVGSMQASETIKVITGIGEPLVDKLALFDALRMELTSIVLQNNDARSTIKTLIDYDDFCGISAGKSKSLNTQKNDTMKEITVQELQEMQESGADFQLIDVREPHEYDICNLGGELIPMSQIPHNVDKISRDKKVVVHCRSGKRSGDMVLWLEKNQGFENLYNLKGGILAWANEIDSDMPTY